MAKKSFRLVASERKRTTNSVHGYKRSPNLVKGLVVERPEQVWVGDITYIRLKDEFVYLAVLMDVFTRSIRGQSTWIERWMCLPAVFEASTWIER